MRHRTLSVPLDHLDAELFAAPFVEPASFTHALSMLDPTLRDPGTRVVWRGTEQRLARSFPNISLDELIARRDRIWFDGDLPTHPRSLTHVIRGIRAHIERDGVDGLAPAAQRRRMRWMTFALPHDLITLCLGNATPSVSPIVRRLLSEGVVEPHLHLGAAVDFDTLWVCVQHSLAARDARADCLASPGAAFNEGRDLACWLLHALVVRALLARYLDASPSSGLGAWLDRILSNLDPFRRLLLARTVRALATGDTAEAAPFDCLRLLYCHLVGIEPGVTGWAHDLEAVRSADAIHPWFPAQSGLSSEQQFVTHALKVIDQDREEPLFARLFWQTIRMRVHLYQHLVQRPSIGGLQWFTRAFARIAVPRGALTQRALIEGARDMSGPVVALELRFKPEDTPSALEQQLDRVVRAAPQGPHVGVILHLTRSRGAGHRAGLPAAFDRDSHVDPTPESVYTRRYGAPRTLNLFRFADYHLDRRRETDAIVELLNTRPATVECLRGIDVCGDELGIPLWVLAPLLNTIRDAGRTAAALVSRPGRVVPPLRLMVHAGEDYIHLLGGLRRIDEYIEYLNLTEGDRIAHAMALGEDVERWCGSAFGRVQPREDYLLDLLWAWRRLREKPSTLLASWGTWLEIELRRLTRDLFGDDLPIECIAEAETLLYDPFALHMMGFPDQPERPLAASTSGALALARRWITDPGVFRRGRAVQEVDPQPLAPLLVALQRLVRRRLSERSIIIEINPSSNLLIGGLTDLGQHPLWRLRPIEPDDAPSLMICIGSDDPITFATSLPEEFQLVYDCLVESGVSSDKALAWLDDARRTSLRGRVALPFNQLPMSG